MFLLNVNRNGKNTDIVKMDKNFEMTIKLKFLGSFLHL